MRCVVVVGVVGDVAIKLGVHIIATIAAIAIVQKEFSDQNDCMETVRSAIAASQ